MQRYPSYIQRLEELVLLKCPFTDSKPFIDSMYSKAIYRFNALSMKILMLFFFYIEIEKNSPKIHLAPKDPKQPKQF